MPAQARPSQQPCRINLPILVVEPDGDAAEAILAILAAVGIPDADLAGSAAEAERRLAEREYSAVIAADAMAAALLPQLAPDDDGERVAPALIVVARHGEEPLPALAAASVPRLSRLALPSHLVPCLKAALAERGIRCKSHRFCGHRSCTAGF